jgi:hypothetical protein
VTVEVTRPNSDATERIEQSSFTWGRLPEFATVIAVGLLMVCLGYAGGRSGASWAVGAYWAGQVLMFTPVVTRLLVWKGVSEREAVGLVLALALAYQLAKICYAPLGFAFNDEFQHWRTAQNMLITQHLFDYNFSLPISPFYPGLESVTVAVVQLTGLSLFGAALIVIGASRLLLTIGLYLLFRRLSGSARAAALASVLYTTTFYYKSILAMFIYTNMALPLLVLVVYGAVRLTGDARVPGPRSSWVLLGLIVAACVITHHLTSYILIIMLLTAAVVHLLMRRRAAGVRLAALATFGALCFSAWVILIAPRTVDYLYPAFSRLIEGITATKAGEAPSSGGLLRSPLLDRTLSYTGIVLLALLLPLAWLWFRRARRKDPWTVAMVVGSATFYAVPVIRLFSASGTEHAARAMNYIYIPVSYVLAGAAVGALGQGERRPAAWGAVLAATLIMAGGITSGWPQYWERVPPPRPLVSGHESGVEQKGLAAAYWVQEILPSDRRIAADQNNATIMGPIGQDTMVAGVGDLFYAADVGYFERALIDSEDVQYIVIDLRLSEQLPANGTYFADDPLANRHTRPIPREALMKFDRLPGVKRVFDSGDIVIYDLTGVTREP